MISTIHTSCKDCIFAEYADITQKDCLLCELEVFRKHNIEILEAYDNEKEFYIINKNKCLRKRTSTWTGANLDWEAKVAQVKKEIAIQYHAIVFANDNMEDICTTILSLYNQKLPPKYVTLIRYADSKINPSRLISPFDGHSHKNIKWRVENVLKKYTDNEIIDLIIPFVSVPIYATFRAGFKVPKNLFNDLNYKIHEDFFQFVMLLPNSTQNGTIVSRQVHLSYQGNTINSLQSKLINENCPYVIPINEVFPYFPK